MKIFERKRHGIHFDLVWFAEESVGRPGITTYHQASFKPEGAKEFVTLVNSLEEDEEAIKSHFSKSCKYKVNRAAREDVLITIKDSSEITDEDIDSFLNFFTSFWESKGTKFSNYESVKRDLTDYRTENALSMGIGTVKGEVAIYHTHICDGNTARLLHSASLYRLKEDEEGNTKNIIGMANRYLHFKEMLHFKESGHKVYDWGGAGRGEDVINITEFKESFGGELKTCYDFEEVKGLKGHLFKILVSIMDDAMN